MLRIHYAINDKKIYLSAASLSVHTCAVLQTEFVISTGIVFVTDTRYEVEYENAKKF